MNPSQRQERNEPSQRRPVESIVPEAGHDPYRLVASPSEPTVCLRCGAIVRDGRWQWLEAGAKAPAGATEVVCPACRRIADGHPGGLVTIEGAFLSEHASDILELLRSEEIQETREHPLHRIATTESLPERIELTTTDTHLPRRLVDALRHAYDGEVAVVYVKDEDLVRARWRRDDPHPPAAIQAQAEPPLPLEVQANGVIVTPEANAYLHERIERLRRFYPRIISCRVVLDAPESHHRQGGPYRVGIQVEVPGADAHINRQQDGNLHVAIRGAFDAAQRVLQDHARKQRGEVSPTQKPTRATVARLFESAGYGFLEAEDGHGVYFHRNSVLGNRFSELRPGMNVRYAEESGVDGPQATSVDW